MKKITWILFSIIIAAPMILKAQDTNTLIIEINNINSHQGQIIIDLYENVDSYDLEVPKSTYKIPKTDVINGELNFQIKIPGATYALAIIDDKNFDNKINRNFIGYPLEGFGFSMYKCFPLRKPEFNNICFELNKKIQRITIELQY